METKHTQGEWRLDETAESAHMASCLLKNDTWIAIEDTSDNGGHIAYCHPDNAHVIAAAPDLLDACQLLLDNVVHCDSQSGMLHKGIKEARDAIAKAIGAAA